jgi:hypothetical protein
MRDGTAVSSRRDAMAKAAAPYRHPQLSSVKLGGDGEQPIVIERIERVIIDPADKDGESLPPTA